MALDGAVWWLRCRCGARPGRLFAALGFPGKQVTLPFDAPAIPGEATVLTHDPMTGDRDSQRIRPARLPDRSHRRRPADTTGYLTIGRRRPEGDLLQHLPDPLLKGCPSNIERQAQPMLRLFDKPDDHRHHPFERGIPADQMRPRETSLKIPHQ